MVFSGGIGKGAYEVGFCRAFEEMMLFDQLKAISASSVGCLNAYAFATHQTDMVEAVWKNTDFKSMREFYNSLVKRPVIMNYIDEFTNREVEPGLTLQFTCIQVPMLHIKYINLEQLEISEQKQLLKASISIPSLMAPVEVCGKKYVDGAIIDNTPVRALKHKKLDVIFVLRFDHSVEDYGMIPKETTIIEVVFKDEHFIKSSFALDYLSTSTMIENGYAYSKEVLEKVFRYGTEDSEYIKYAATLYNRGSRSTIIPKNGDDIVRKINKLSKIFPT